MTKLIPLAFLALLALPSEAWAHRRPVHHRPPPAHVHHGHAWGPGYYYPPPAPYVATHVHGPNCGHVWSPGYFQFGVWVPGTWVAVTW